MGHAAFDWAGGEESLRMNYVIPSQDSQTEHLFGARTYYGQVVSLLYKGEILDVQAWPRDLAAKIPQFTRRKPGRSGAAGIPGLAAARLRSESPAAAAASLQVISPSLMNPASEERQLGEYRLKELLAETPVARTWLAEQISVSRKVLVDELRANRIGPAGSVSRGRPRQGVRGSSVDRLGL